MQYLLSRAAKQMRMGLEVLVRNFVFQALDADDFIGVVGGVERSRPVLGDKMDGT